MSFVSRIFQSARRHTWRTLITTIIILAVAVGAYVFSRPAKPEYVTGVSERRDLIQTVEAAGTVISERDLALQFPRSGVIAEVFVKEGDTVKAGDRLAQLRAGAIAADVAAARARLDSAEADLLKMREGNRQEDIRITEAELANRRASLAAANESLQTAEDAVRSSEDALEAIEKEISTGLSGETSVALSTLSRELTVAEKSLSIIDDIWSDNDVLDAMIKDKPEEYDFIKSELFDVRTAINETRRQLSQTSGYGETLQVLGTGSGASQRASDVLTRAFTVISGLPVTGTYTNEDREAHKSSLSNERNAVQSSLHALENASANLKNAAAGYETKLINEESALSSAEGARDKALADIRTSETAVRMQEAQLALMQAGNRPSDIASAEARVRQSRAELARAGADYGDTILTAPIDGTVTAVHVKKGELSPSGATINLLGESPYRVEVFISEVDIPKVKLTQSGSIELDAFPGVHYKLRVSEIDVDTTTVDGIEKYRVKLDFLYPHDEFKIGMSGDAEIITGQRKNVITVPERAVIEDENGDTVIRVILPDGEVTRQSVETGMRGGESADIEIIKGLEEGETVILLEK